MYQMWVGGLPHSLRIRLQCEGVETPDGAGTVNIRLYALRLYDTLSYNWESNYVQNRPFCHCGAGEKFFLVAARTFVAHLFLHGCACVGVIHKRISTVTAPCARPVYWATPGGQQMCWQSS